MIDLLLDHSVAKTNCQHVSAEERSRCCKCLFQEKYGMSLAECEANAVVKAQGYSFEVESAHQDWDLAVDGIRTIERRLASLPGRA
jgi:hypothetical protein